MNILLDILSIVGALGLFIYGMKVMSDGVQRAAGATMRRVVGAMTRSRARGVFTGVLTTSLIQSSSATTVMVVSFVNAGIIKLREAIAVIMGANIGTTITAWVIAFALGRVDIREFALPMIGLALPLLFIKKAHLRYSGEVVIGFALMFIGLQLLQGTIPNLRTSPQILDFFASEAQVDIWNILYYVLLGTVAAVVLQSSTAAMALTLTLMTGGIIPVEFAAAMVLGENIGTTVTANIAAVVANRSAKITARAHTVFNVLGVAWMIVILPFVVHALDTSLDSFFPDFQNQDGKYALMIAILHTGFNVINTALWVAFIPFVETLASKLVRGESGKDRYNLEYIGSPVMGTPELAILGAQKEMRRFAKVTLSMNETLMRLLETSDPDDRMHLLDELRRTEEVTDRFERNASRYLNTLSQEEVSDLISRKVQGLLSAANDLERIGDLYYQIALNLEAKNKQKVYFIPKQRQSLKEMTVLLREAFEIMLDNLRVGLERVDASEAKRKELQVNEMKNTLRLRHIKDQTKDKYTLESGVFYSDTFTALEEIADHIFSVSEGLGDLEEA